MRASFAGTSAAVWLRQQCARLAMRSISNSAGPRLSAGVRNSASVTQIRAINTGSSPLATERRDSLGEQEYEVEAQLPVWPIPGSLNIGERLHLDVYWEPHFAHARQL